VFDASSGRHEAECDRHLGDIWTCAFSPDGARLASGGEDQTVRIWDASTGALVATCRGHASKVVAAAFRADGARLVTTSSDGTVRQWNPATGQEVEEPYDQHSGEVAAAAYSPDGNWVASAGADRTVRVWRASGRQDLAILHGHTGTVTAVAFDSGGRRLASLSAASKFGWNDKTARVWDVHPAASLPALRGHTKYVYPVAFSPDGRWIASGSWDDTVRLWDAATGEPCAILRHSGSVRTLAFGPDGRWLVTGDSASARLQIWDVATARVRKKIEVPGSAVFYVAVSPDGTKIATSAAETQFSVVDVSTGNPLFVSEGNVFTYSPDGRWLAVRAVDGTTVLVLDARTHRTVARLSGHDALVQGALFSPDSRLLASYGVDRIVRLWRIDSGTCRVLHGHTDQVFAAAFHPDGRRLATAGRDRAIWLWDLERGDEVVRLPGHTSYVWSLAFSPDGDTLASGSGDFTVRLWDTAPLKTRYKAQREAAALRNEADELVERLWKQKQDDIAIVEALQSDHALSDAQRHAARLALLRRTATRERGK
jgi:WD40 repeat protein